MPWPEAVEAVPMSRVAVVGPSLHLRDVLLVLADAGVTELETTADAESGEAAEALRRLRATGVDAPEPALAGAAHSPDELEARRRADLLAGEVQLESRSLAAARRGPFAVLVGWCPRTEIDSLRIRLEPRAAGVVELPKPPFAEPPTLLRTHRGARAFRPLVETYGTGRYEDIDPTPFAAISFVLMFGMMFADAGHGLLLAAAGLALRLSRNSRLARLRQNWLLPFAGGLVAAVFGFAYGEFFGPTGVVPVVWLRPLQNPLQLLFAGVLVGAVLLAVSHLIGTVNRWREGGVGEALYSSSGVAGTLVFGGLGGLALAVWIHSWAVFISALVPVGAGLVLMFIGFFGRAGGGGIGVVEATVELFNSVMRLGANSISFARLAAFGIAHASIGALVWNGATAMFAAGLWFVAVPVFLIGNALAFVLELVVVSIQALRLTYYELFSRIYAGEGRPFDPWHLRVIKEVP
jgi:V/A-type H+-transporting ATPase subunit I